MSRTSTILVAAALSGLGCEPDLPRRPSLIDAPRLIAVVTEPAESKPEDAVLYQAYVAAPDGTLSAPDLAWALCRTPKPPTESRSVDDACLAEGAVPLAEERAIVAVTTPEDACFLFGPNTPPGDARPRDADVTGGFYMPVRVTVAGAASFAMHRIHCDLANAPVDVSIVYQKSYLLNDNPTIVGLGLEVAGAEVMPDAVPAGAEVTLRLRWTPESVEAYPVYDRERRALVTRDESLRAVWFATGGTFEHDATGATGPSEGDNRWTAPEAGTVFLWAVLRDDRGGTAVLERRIDVE